MNLRSPVRAGLVCTFLSVWLIGAAPHDPSSSNADAVAAFNQGANAFNAKRYADAIDAYTRAIALDPEFAAAYRDRGDAETSLVRNAAAIADYTVALRLDPSDEYGYVERGQAYNNIRSSAEALADASRAIRMDGNDGNAYVVRGNALAGLARFSAALAAFKTADVLSPDSFGVHFGRGLTYLAMCDNRHAIVAFGAALGIRDDAGARNDRGLAFMASKAYGPAMTDFTRAIALDRSVEPFVNRGVLAMKQKRYPAAEADFDAALAIDNTDPQAYADRAGVFALEHRFSYALRDAASAVQWDEAIGADLRRLHEPDPKVYRRLADVYERLGAPSLAASNRAAAAKLTKASGSPECPV